MNKKQVKQQTNQDKFVGRQTSEAIQQKNQMIFTFCDILIRHKYLLNNLCFFHLQIKSKTIFQMKKIQQLRKTALQEIDAISTKQRFGYFTIPANLSVGDTQFSQKKVQKDENGRVVTQPRNIYIKPTASGRIKSSYFQFEKSIYDGDIYMDPGKITRLEGLKQKKKYESKELYKYVDGITKSLIKAPYQYISCRSEQKNPKAKRNQQGRVIIQEKNVTTNPMSKVIKDLFKFPKYESSPYDAQHMKHLHQKKQNNKKLQETPFKSASSNINTFSKSRQVFGPVDKNQKKEKKNIKIKKESAKNIVIHQAPFKPSNPSKSGQMSSIGKFPPYICTSPPNIVRKLTPEGQRKQHFKIADPQKKTMPSPSISLNKMNLRKYIR